MYVCACVATSRWHAAQLRNVGPKARVRAESQRPLPKPEPELSSVPELPELHSPNTVKCMGFVINFAFVTPCSLSTSVH
jgi:hypothetical protein